MYYSPPLLSLSITAIFHLTLVIEVAVRTFWILINLGLGVIFFVVYPLPRLLIILADWCCQGGEDEDFEHLPGDPDWEW